MKRGIIVFMAAVMLWTPVLSTQAAANADAVQTVPVKVDLEALREQLVKGLKVTRPPEEEFIDHILVLVGKNELPVSLVYAAFRWARRRRPDYPFPYFVSAIKALAKKNKIEI
jgi:hypothetical protein